MKFSPILFSTPMVQAILSNQKFQTRRTNGLDKLTNHYFQSMVHHYTGKFTFVENGNFNPEEKDVIEVKCPYGKVGDVLWVRETMIFNKNSQTYWPVSDGYKRSISPLTNKPVFEYEKVVSSIHMPKKACRLFLKITDIRVEQLNHISRGDAMLEGCHFANMQTGPNPVDWFKDLWKSMNGEESWNSNPWVWVISFERIDKPENFS
ncbi:hypothetical protein [Flavobacterium sp.]|uniref:hypothetical protein n=1 Tax=Flavobacterium sp. TaxID=239 RepID=UPI0022C5CFF8|nr:hypothetical protein [Flavobacterium sp.]MCZ8144884.1 hypothetical protein [Flavobacterium sp.]